MARGRQQESAGHGRSLRIVAAALAVLVLALPPASAAIPIDEHPAIHEGDHYSYKIVSQGSYAYGVHIQWNSSVPVDAWIMAADDFYAYERTPTIHFEVQQSGKNGTMDFRVPEDRFSDEPFFFVIDHSAKGSTLPPAAPGDDIATVDIVGQISPDVIVTYNLLPPLDAQFALGIAADILIFVGVPVAIWYYFKREKKKREIRTWEAQRKAERAGMAPTAMTAGGGAPVRAAAWQAPAAAPAPWTPAGAAPRFCTSCGAPLAPALRFCTGCGFPAG